MKPLLYTSLLTGSILALLGCAPSGAASTTPSAPAIVQDQICEVDQWQRDAAAEVCKAGQKVVFLPKSFGNEQLPILFAAVNCDLRYTVVSTKGGVTCIYAPLKPVAAQASEPEAKK